MRFPCRAGVERRACPSAGLVRFTGVHAELQNRTGYSHGTRGPSRRTAGTGLGPEAHALVTVLTSSNSFKRVDSEPIPGVSDSLGPGGPKNRTKDFYYGNLRTCIKVKHRSSTDAPVPIESQVYQPTAHLVSAPLPTPSSAVFWSKAPVTSSSIISVCIFHRERHK